MKYDFKCEEHGMFELDQKITETTRTAPCPECQAECNKVIGVAMFSCTKAAGYKLKDASFGKKN